MLKLRKNKKGFTLVELIVVIAIMAVLAGTVAGVTVTQLNKQTDNANQTKAKQVADFVAGMVADPADFEDITNDDGTFDGTAVADKVKAQFGETYTNESASKGGEFALTVDETSGAIKIYYKGKQRTGGDITYFVTTDGTISTTAPAATQTPVTPTPNPNPGE